MLQRYITIQKGCVIHCFDYDIEWQKLVILIAFLSMLDFWSFCLGKNHVTVAARKMRFKSFNTCFSCLITWYSNIAHLNRSILNISAYFFFAKIFIKNYWSFQHKKVFHLGYFSYFQIKMFNFNFFLPFSTFTCLRTTFYGHNTACISDILFFFCILWISLL